MAYRKINITELLPADVIVITDRHSPISATIRSLTGSGISHAMLYAGMLFLLFSLTGCTTINKWRSTSPILVSGPISIGPEWVEIIPPKPLISRAGTMQYIEVYTEHNTGGNWGENGKTLKLKNGVSSEIEGILYDEKGNEYELFINSDMKESIGLSHDNPNIKGFENFPEGEYTKLKIRSNIPLQCEKIEWSASYSSDQLF